MQPTNPNQPGIEMRYRSLLILWSALLISLALWIVVIRFSRVSGTANQRLSLLLICLSLVPAALSLLGKQALIAKAIERQDVGLVQPAYVVAWALSELAALLGLLDYFVTGSSYYYYAFIVGGIAMVLNFPQKKHLEAASYRQF